MELKHIGLAISDIKEITDFYIEILGMKQARTFVLNKTLAETIFGCDIDVPVFLMQKDNLFLEIFVAPSVSPKKFAHLCLSVENRELIFAKAKAKGFQCNRIKRKPHDLIFIRDGSGNIFEIKEIYGKFKKH